MAYQKQRKSLYDCKIMEMKLPIIDSTITISHDNCGKDLKRLPKAEQKAVKVR